MEYIAVANPLAADLDHILAHTAGLWNELQGKRLFLSGGSGFFGCWFLESFLWANAKLDLGARAMVLTRDGAAFRQKAPHLAVHPAVEVHCGDVRSFPYPEGRFTHIIHAAATTRASLYEEDPLAMLDTIATGTRNMLEFARHCGAESFLLTSSGAVYGKQPADLTTIPEDYVGSPDTLDPRFTYAEGKRLAEHLCCIYYKQYGLKTKIARCFAFVGPYLPLDRHFAIANFIRDGLQGGPIQVNGDGTPYRSYLYAADLVIWLWTILMRSPPCRSYNVGSEVGLPIAEVARAVAEAFSPPPPVRIAQAPVPAQPPERYVPLTHRALAELGLKQTVDLQDSIRRTVHWYKLTAGL